MNNFKRARVLVLAMLLCVAAVLGACGGQEAEATGAPDTNDVTYVVKVVDALERPYTEGVIVRFLRNGEQTAMQVVDENGAVSKTLEKGDYTVELMFTNDEGSYYYDQTDLTLSAEKTELVVELAYTPAPEAVSLYAQGKETIAYRVSEGCTYVSLKAGERNYFLFSPTVAGTYEISMVGSAAAIGYYGAPHFVQELSAVDVVDGVITVSISSGMIGSGNTGTTTLVIGIDAGDAEDCVLSVVRAGEAEHTLADEPWMIYEKTVELAPYSLPSGAALGEFDLTASADTYKLVLNESDGFYHLDSADGPLVLCRLGVNSKYLDSFKTIVDHSGVSKYFYNEDGSFQKKENYTDCLLEYLKYIDEENGVYPLTEDLKYIIQMRGDQSGWFDADGQSYLFKDQDGNIVPDINEEISWLFMCCYIKG